MWHLIAGMRFYPTTPSSFSLSFNNPTLAPPGLSFQLRASESNSGAVPHIQTLIALIRIKTWCIGCRDEVHNCTLRCSQPQMLRPLICSNDGTLEYIKPAVASCGSAFLHCPVHCPSLHNPTSAQHHLIFHILPIGCAVRSSETAAPATLPRCLVACMLCCTA